MKKGKDHYRALQVKSMEARISRNLTVEVWADPKLVTSLPWRKRRSDAGFDLASAEKIRVMPGTAINISTGLKIRCPEGYFYRIESRSSLLQEGVMALPGVIDATYSGVIHVPLFNFSSSPFLVDVTDRIAQIIFYPQLHPVFHESEMVGETGRASDGWGSSGRKH